MWVDTQILSLSVVAVYVSIVVVQRYRRGRWKRNLTFESQAAVTASRQSREADSIDKKENALVGNVRADPTNTPPVEVATSRPAPPAVGEQGHLVLSLIMSVMADACGVVPKEFWGLNHSIDLQAPRNFVIDNAESEAVYGQRLRPRGPRPYQIIKLTTSDAFNTPITIIRGVKVVSFGKKFNSIVTLTAGVEEVFFGYAFNSSIENLPNSLRVLEFGRCFNRPITFPASIRHLAFGARFNQRVVLPEKVEFVEFGAFYDQPTLLPRGIREVQFARSSGSFRYPLLLPNGIQKLTLHRRFVHPITLPETLKEVDIGGTFGSKVILPEGLEKLAIWNPSYKQPLVLPSTLKKILVCRDYWWPLSLPPGCVREFC